MSADISAPANDNPVTDNLALWSGVYIRKAATGRGSNGKISPYGIQKLRELILELAVRGKLVLQDPNDEPASVLLERIAKKKAYLIKEKVTRKTKVPTPFGEQAPHKLPCSWSWSWTTLYEMGEIGPRNSIDDELDTAFVPMRCISQKYGAPVAFDLRPWREIKKGFTHFQDNDVVLAKITPCFQNGKSAVMQGLKNGLGAGTTELHVFRPINGTIVPEFVLVYLKSPGFILGGIPKMTGTAGQKRITRDYFAGKHFPLPPLPEQHRIVAKVDELMALCDQLEQQQTDSIAAHQTLVETLLGALTTASDQRDFEQTWQRIAENFDTLFTTEHSIDQLKQTILQLAIMGKLVPQDPKDEPASVLLEKIAEEKERLIKERKIKKQKALPEMAEEEMPFDLPSGWVWARAAKFSQKITDGEHFRPRTQQEGVYFLSAKDIREDGVSLDDPLYVSEKVAEEALQRCNPERGDILIVSRGATVGRMCTVTIDEVFCLLGSVILIKPVPPILSDYLKIVMKSPHTFEELVTASGSTAQPAIYLRDLKKIAFPVAPLAEQHRIVTKVDKLMAICDALKTRLQEARTTQTQLADAIVAQAVA